MAVLLFLLAFLMAGIGFAAAAFGVPFIFQAERGMAMVVAGSVVGTGGILLLAAAVLARRLGRIATQLVVLAASLDEVAASASAARSASMDEAEVPVVRRSAPPPPPVLDQPADPFTLPTSPPEPAPAKSEVVGQYSSGQNSYVMFADGSVQADTPGGRHRFSSLDELRAFVAAGGERLPA